MYFSSLYPDWFLADFFYDNDEEKPTEIDGVPVYKITEKGIVDSCGSSAEYDKNADVYVGTRGIFFVHAQKALQGLGFTRIFFYNQELDNQLRNEFIPEYYKDHGWGFRKIDELVRERHLEAVDVILPVPLFVNPNVRENYCGRHTSFTWDAMMEVLSEMYPEYLEEAKQVFEKSGCYCPCNMLIARKEIFDEMCSWLFPILFTVLERCGIIDDKYQNRYPGFLAERLITLFFHFNESRYNIVYADKAFLG